MNLPTKNPLRMAALISGTGRTLRNLIEKIEEGRLNAEIRLVVASTPAARGLQHAEKAGIPIELIPPTDFASLEDYSQAIFECCQAADVDLVVLAGFTRRLTIPEDFHNRVVDTHPALVPAFSGKGLYGDHVYEAALEYGVKLSGCTVHFVDNQYEPGPVILQRAVPVLDDDTLESLEARVFAAECEAYCDALSLIADGCVTIDGRRVRTVSA